MDLIFIRSTGVLSVGDSWMRAWSKVRNEVNGFRPSFEKTSKGDQDVFFMYREDGSKGPPSMPRPFPVGKWKITDIREKPDPVADKYFYPVYIATDAHQSLDIWELDGRGFYLRNTNVKEEDYAYGLHFSVSEWTQGCMRIGTESDARWLAKHVHIGDDLTVI